MENINYNFDYHIVFFLIQKIPALKYWAKAAISHSLTDLISLINDRRNWVCLTGESKGNLALLALPISSFFNFFSVHLSYWDLYGKLSQRNWYIDYTLWNFTCFN
jgi:hypothetical protein